MGDMLQVTCYGPDATSGTLEVCNPTCSEQTAPVYTQSAVCDPAGYSYDPATRLCTYTPLAAQAGSQGCPAGYALIPPGRFAARRSVSTTNVRLGSIRLPLWRLCPRQWTGELQPVRSQGCQPGKQLLSGMPGRVCVRFSLAMLPGASHRTVSRLPARSCL